MEKMKDYGWDSAYPPTMTEAEFSDVARKKKVSAAAFVHALMETEEYSDRLIRAWERRLSLGRSVAPLAEEYGGPVSSEKLKARINQHLTAAREAAPGQVRAEEIVKANISLEVYLRLFLNSHVPLHVRVEVEPFYSEYITHRNALVSANLLLVPSFARGFLNQGVDFSDLVQHGYLGLIRAVDKFDPDRDRRLSTYASFWIRRFLSDAVKDFKRTIRVPRHVPALIGKVASFTAKYEVDHGESPSLEVIEKQFPGLTPYKYYILRNSQTEVRPFDVRVLDPEDGADCYQTVYGEQVHISPEKTTQAVEERILRRLINKLPSLERRVIMLRYGIDCLALPTTKVAETVGVSVPKLKSIEQRALSALREVMTNE